MQLRSKREELDAAAAMRARHVFKTWAEFLEEETAWQPGTAGDSLGQLGTAGDSLGQPGDSLGRPGTAWAENGGSCSG